MMLYRNLSGYLREKYGRRLKKICIDGGFTCPNRDGKCGTGGCIFCGERGAGEHIDPTLSIREQVARGLAAGKDEDLFIAYFQNFTNTYASVEVLRERYFAALTDERIKILSVGTRPDCIDREVCELLCEIGKSREVWVELGLQTANDRTAEAINRGYPLSRFIEAAELLREYGLKLVVHLMLGLPGEGLDDYRATASLVSSLSPFGVKIHSVYVMEGTRLAEDYRKGLYTPPTLSEYVEGVCEVISRLGKETVLHRITGDCPRDMLLAPEWNTDKRRVIDEINKELSRRALIAKGE